MTSDLQIAASPMAISVHTPEPVISVPEKLSRTLHIINGEHYSGAERVQDLLAQRLPDYGFDVGFVCVKPDKFPRFRTATRAELFEAPMRNSFDLSVAKQVAAVVKAGDVEVIHAHTTRSCMIGRVAAALTGRPLIYHVHSPTSQDSTRRLANYVNSWVERISLHGAAKIVCVSHSLADHMCSEGFSRRRLAVVPNGVPIRGPLTQRDTPCDAWVLGTVALFRPRKGTEVLLEALSMLRAHGYNVSLRAVGPFESPEYESRIKSLAKKLGVAGNVEWTGFTSNVDLEMAKMDLFVLPSLFGEGLPMVMLEAMAAGIPVVGTRVQGIPEVLQDNAGVLAAPDSAADLSHAIRTVIRGDMAWAEIRQTAWQRQRDRFSDHSMAAGLAAAYRQLD